MHVDEQINKENTSSNPQINNCDFCKFIRELLKRKNNNNYNLTENMNPSHCKYCFTLYSKIRS